MKFKKSELELVEFSVVQSDFSVVSPKSQKDLDDSILNYEIDINYTFPDLKSKPHRIFLKIEINKTRKQKAGYSIFVEGVAFFNLPDNMNEVKKLDLLNYSGVPILLGNIRSFIASMTSFAPFGRYIVPSIDLQDLLMQKVKSIEPTPTLKKAAKQNK